MATIKVYIGTVQSGSSGQENDTRRQVQFDGEQLAHRTEYGRDAGGNVTNTRGTTETLYRAADGGLVVHVREWSHWQGEPDTASLYRVTAEDLGPDGPFEFLGYEAGLGRALTLDEALGDDGRDKGDRPVTADGVRRGLR